MSSQINNLKKRTITKIQKRKIKTKLSTRKSNAQQLNMQQKVDHSTHIYGGILYLVFDTKNSKGSTDWMPTPFSDHFIIYYDL